MIEILVAALCMGLFFVFSVRHFFVQLLGIKLLLDALVLLLISAHGESANPLNAQTAAVLISALSALVFFVLMAAGIQRFSKSGPADLGVGGD